MENIYQSPDNKKASSPVRRRRFGLPGSKDVPLRVVIPHFFGILFMALVVTSLFSYVMHRKDIESRRIVFERQEHSLSRLASEVSTQYFRSILADLAFLSQDRQIDAVLRWNDPLDISTLESQWVLFSAAKGTYHRLNLLDREGTPKTIVDYNNGLPFALPNPAAYSRDHEEMDDMNLALLHPGAVNAEMHGTPDPGDDDPLVLHFATGIHDTNGTLQGILVLDYFADTILDRLGKATSETDSILMVIDADGRWILGPEPENNTGFELEPVSSGSFADTFPEALPLIMSERAGQFYDTSGLFTYSTLFFPEQTAKRIPKPAITWKMVTFIPNRQITQASAVIALTRTIRGHFGLVLILGIVSAMLAVSITRKKMTERALAENEAMLTRLIESMPDCVCFKDVSGKWIVSNEANLELYGLKGVDYRGKTNMDLAEHSPISEEMFLTSELADADALDGSGVKRTEESHILPDGHKATFDMLKVPIVDASVGPIGVLLLGRNITERKRVEEDLKHFATIDPLTGVFNRRTGLIMLEERIKLARRTNKPFVVGYVDINELKHVNDTYGHHEGDALIKAVVRGMTDTIRDSDTIARLGGDEFLIIFVDCDLTHAEHGWERVESRIHELSLLLDKPYKVSVSRGFAPHDGRSDTSADRLIAIADEAMYRHKTSTRT